LDDLKAALADRYCVEREIGRGGMGTVFLARDVKHDRPVALKILNPELAAALGPERFLREIAIAAGLNHPHIVALYDSGQAGGTFYYAMPFVPGESLRARLLRERQLPLDEAIAIVREVADALSYAHSHDIIHRDIKPENILLSGGHALVVDFGIGRAITAAQGDRLTETGIAVGTPGYMSPEQATADPYLDGRSDLYSLGCVAYEMLAGHPPFLGATAREVIARHTLDAVPPLRTARPVVPAAVEQAVGRALAKVPADRFATAAQFAEALTGPLAAGAPASPQLTTIAVLPFLFLSEAQASPALSLGFADALITILGSLEDVAVLPTSAILKYAPGSDAARASRDLGVRHILQGNIQTVGAQWRVSIQLFDAAAQRIILSENQDFQRDNVFEVQDAIGRRMVDSLHSRSLLAAPKSRDRYSGDPEAYEEFMAGLRDSYSDREDTLRSAAEHLTRAVERDPGFALAHAWLSQVSMQIHYYFDAQRTWLEQAESHCHRALALDPALPEGHWARSAILWSPAKNFQHADAIAALEQVLAVRPNFDRAHNRMAAICLHIGRFHDARIAHAASQRANPKNRTYNLEYIHLYSGDFARAEEAAAVWLREAPDNWSAWYYGAQPPLMTGDLDLAEQRLAAGLRLSPNEASLLSLQGVLHARRSQARPALECVRQALDLPIGFGHAHHTYYQVACIYALLSEPDKAMAWLERSVDTGYPCWPFFTLDPHLKNLREHTAFTRLVADVEHTYAGLKIQRL
jgi:serine/threonine protein kinase/Flp pilus assembly protein TadD